MTPNPKNLSKYLKLLLAISKKCIQRKSKFRCPRQTWALLLSADNHPKHSLSPDKTQKNPNPVKGSDLNDVAPQAGLEPATS